MHTLLDLLEWHGYRTTLHRWPVVQWKCSFVRLARECWRMSKAPWVLITSVCRTYFCMLCIFTELLCMLCFSQALCNDDANGNVPLGKSCNRYWQCQGGYPRLQRCPAMLVFDRRSLRCVVPPTEDCDAPTTQIPIEGELPENGAAPVRGNGNAVASERPQQFQEEEDDGFIPRISLNSYSEDQP